MAKKKHHYLPEAYLKAFCDNKGQIYVCRKDNPSEVFQTSPSGTGHHEYYYAQPRPDGERDTDTLEEIFNTYETHWPRIVNALLAKKNVNDRLVDIFSFITLQRLRVPAARDAFEKMLAASVKMTAQNMEAAGMIPPMPKSLEHLRNHIEVAIDPHQSIHAMKEAMPGVGELLDRLGLCAIHNNTGTSFITSDNPVIWLDPSVPMAELRPYAVRPDGPVVLLFPVTPHILLYGDTNVKDNFSKHGLWHTECNDVKMIEGLNEWVCRFAYRDVYSIATGFQELVEVHAETSPVIRTDVMHSGEGQYISHQFVFGKRSKKPKWERR